MSLSPLASNHKKFLGNSKVPALLQDPGGAAAPAHQPRRPRSAPSSCAPLRSGPLLAAAAAGKPAPGETLPADVPASPFDRVVVTKRSNNPHPRDFC